MIKGYIDHPSLGRVIMTVNPRARQFTARWKNGLVAMTVPAGVGMDEINRVLDSLSPRLLSRRPAPHYLAPGSVWSFPDFEVRVDGTGRDVVSGQIIAPSGKSPLTLLLFVNPSWDAGVLETGVGKVLRRMASRIAAPLLLPRAREIAAGLGISGISWEIGRGIRRLGSCSSGGKITISSVCIFLPWRLREYIICHELAHLTHFDHSSEFHALCSRYCGGDGDERRAELKSYVLPVPLR